MCYDYVKKLRTEGKTSYELGWKVKVMVKKNGKTFLDGPCTLDVPITYTNRSSRLDSVKMAIAVPTDIGDKVGGAREQNSS